MHLCVGLIIESQQHSGQQYQAQHPTHITTEPGAQAHAHAETQYSYFSNFAKQIMLT